jgi:tungstate transport system ATP-binding protein
VTVLDVTGITVSYSGRTVLSVPRLSVHRGEVLSVVGPNGAGKSTLLRVLGLLERPATGTVVLDGQPVRYDAGALVAARRRMAAVFQAPLLCDTSVATNIGMGLRFRGVSGPALSERVRRAAETFDIAHLLERRARTLSGGEAQRTSLARAFALDPEVLFLDEPFAALDAPSRETILSDLEVALRDSPVTTVFVTHDRDEALLLGDRVAVMMRSSIAQLDTPERVFSAPASEEVARFVGVDNIVRGVIRERREAIAVVVAPQGPEIRAACAIPAGRTVLVCLRPENLVLAPADAASPFGADVNVLPGVVRRVIRHGAQLRVDVDAGIPLIALVPRYGDPRMVLEEGQKVQVGFAAQAAHVICGPS